MYENKVSFDEGFYVSRENAITFLEEKLDLIGLNKKEKNALIEGIEKYTFTNYDNNVLEYENNEKIEILK